MAPPKETHTQNFLWLSNGTALYLYCLPVKKLFLILISPIWKSFSPVPKDALSTSHLNNFIKNTVPVRLIKLESGSKIKITISKRKIYIIIPPSIHPAFHNLLYLTIDLNKLLIGLFPLLIFSSNSLWVFLTSLLSGLASSNFSHKTSASLYLSLVFKSLSFKDSTFS